MKYLHLVFLAVGGFSADLVRSENLPFPVSIPVRIQAGVASEDSSTKIPVEVRTLMDHLREPKELDFITGPEPHQPIPGLKWAVANMTIVSPEIVLVDFSEGHTVVTGVFVRNHKDRGWEVRTAIHGQYKKQKTSEQAVAPNGSLPPLPK